MMSTSPKLEDAVTGQALGSQLAHAEPVINLLDRVQDRMGQLAQSWDDYKASERKTLSEKYLEHRISLLLNVSVLRPRNSVSGDQVVDDLPLGNPELFSLLIDKNDSVNEFVLHFCDEEPMLVSDVEVVEGVNEVPVPVRVRLYRFHDTVDNVFGDSLFKSLVNSCFKVIPGLTHGKTSVFASALDGSEFNFRNNVVKGRSEIVQGISEGQSKGIGQSLTRSDFESVISAIRIVLNNDFVGLSIRELPQYHIEVIDMLYGPLDF